MAIAMFFDIILNILVGGFALCFLMGICATGLELNASFPGAWRSGSYFLVLWLLLVVQIARYSIVWCGFSQWLQLSLHMYLSTT